MTITFPHANRFSISDDDFICAWEELANRYGPVGSSITTPLARLNTTLGIAHFSANAKRKFSLDYLCRILVPNGFRNGMQATGDFMRINAHLVTAHQCMSPVSGRLVNGARLNGHAACREVPKHIEALFDADCDESLEDQVANETSRPAVNKPSSGSIGGIPEAVLIRRFVESIHLSGFETNYRGRTIRAFPGSQNPQWKPGWPTRLREYFWPSPAYTYSSSVIALAPLLAEAKRLAALAKWSPSDENAAVKLANEIFRWGNVPQDPATVTPSAILAVFDAAITGNIPPVGTPMNSGWTKVAAFASAHLEGVTRREPQVIFDSRVATSILSRIEDLLSAAKVTAIPTYLQDIGRIPGRGGTRPRTFSLNWPNGYMKWDSQFAATRFVLKVRDHLNQNLAKYGHMPTPDRSGKMGKGVWTVRGVEMVLFMDGY